MKYRTIVNLLKFNEVGIWDVLIATTVDSLDYKDIDENEFEELCKHTSYLALKDPNCMATECIAKMLHALRKDKSWDEIDNMSKYDLLDKAIKYQR